MNTCAVIPAAGRGTRLGEAGPKVLTSVRPGETILRLLVTRLLEVVEHVHVVASPAARTLIDEELRRIGVAALTSIGIQESPTGMGDAIFCGAPVWERYRRILVVWGDQVHVSEGTFSRALAAHAFSPHRVVIPVVPLREPYVEYRFSPQGSLERVLQSREGDRCAQNGLGDVGTFVLSTAELAQQWRQYSGASPAGSVTGERNFLPFLPYLAANGWRVGAVEVLDPTEARGINTPEDLEFFRVLLRSGAARTMER